MEPELTYVEGPHYLKVVSSIPLIEATGIHFKNARDRAKDSKGFSYTLLQLRDEIFSIYGIEEIFIDRTTVVVVRKPDIQWADVIYRVCQAIRDHLK